MGTEVTVSFLLTCGVMAGFEAMKAAGWRIWAFGTVATIFIIAGLGWFWLKDISPPIAAGVTQIAESPQSWFLLLVVALALIAVTGRQKDKTELISPFQIDDEPLTISRADGEILASIDQFGKQMSSLTSKVKDLTDSSDAIRNLERTAFLLATSVTENLGKNEIQKCLRTLPVPPPPNTLGSDENAARYTTLLNQYFTEVGSRLSGTRWGNLLMSSIRIAERDADFELQSINFPPQLHPQTFRTFHIACLTRQRVQTFLERAIAEAEESERQMLQMIRERPEIHSPPKR